MPKGVYERKKKNEKTELENPSNGAHRVIDDSRPYIVEAVVEGTSSLLMHAWNTEEIEEKQRSKKGSQARKTDDLESYVYRNDDGEISLRGEGFRMGVINAAKFQRDPRSSRKTAADLYKAGVVVLEEFCSLGVKEWEFVAAHRARIQMSHITRRRPGFNAGWRTTVTFNILLAEYIDPQTFLSVLNDAGKFYGVGDFRPTYGRFQVVDYRVKED